MIVPIDYSFLTMPSHEDCNQIIGLYREANWWQPPDAEQGDLVSRIVHGSHCFVIAREGHRFIAMGRAISDRTSDAYIQDVIVASNYRRHGIGSRIIQMIISRLKRDGIRWIGLIAAPGSIAFYHSAGFRSMERHVPMILREDNYVD